MAGRINYKEVYEVLDPIIRERPKINWKELERDHKEIADKISYGAFLARKKKLLGIEGYTYPPKKKAKRNRSAPIDIELVPSITSKMDLSDKAILKFVKKVLPNSKRKEEYKDLFVIIAREPETTHTELKRRGLVTISDPCYYAFRRKVLAFIGKHKESNGKSDKSEPESTKSEVSKEGAIFRIIITNKEANEEVVDEAKKIVERIREEKGINIDIEELKTGYEIREYSK